ANTSRSRSCRAARRPTTIRTRPAGRAPRSTTWTRHPAPRAAASRAWPPIGATEGGSVTGMSQVSEIAFTIAAPPRAVLDHLNDPRSYVGLSPLVVEVRDIRADADGVVHYIAVERFRFLGFLHYDNA